MRGRGRLRRGSVVVAAVVATAFLVIVTAAMLLLPAASPRRIIAGTLEAGDPSGADNSFSEWSSVPGGAAGVDEGTV